MKIDFLLKFTLILFVSLSNLSTSGAVPTSSQAQIPAEEVVPEKPMLRLKTYSYKEGLSNSSVEYMVQDDKGYLWVSTQAGLNRFNGQEFVQFFPDKDNPQAIKSQFAISLFKDDNGRIWFGGNGLSYIAESGNSFVNYPLKVLGDKPLYVTHIAQAENENFWLLAAKTLWHFDTSNQSIVKVEGQPPEILFIFGDKQENLWLGTNYGVFKKSGLESEYIKIENYPETGNDIQDMKINGGFLWVLTNKHLVKLNLSNLKWEYEKFNHPVVPVEMQKILFNNEDIWLSSMNGLWMKQEKCSCWHQYVADPIIKNALPINQMRPLYFDKQSQLWIGTTGGGLSVRNPKHQMIKHWLNKRQLSSYSNSLFFSSTTVTDINPDRRGSLLVSTGDQGVFKLSYDGVIEKHYTKENTPEILTNDINQVIVDLHQRLWLSSYPEGIVMHDAENNWHEFKTDEKGLKNMRHEFVFELYEDRVGDVWAGTLAGAKVYNPETDSFDSLTSEYPANVMTTSARTNVIRQTLNGLYWLGTEGGVIVLDKNKKFLNFFSESSENQPIISDEINDITEDSMGNVWIATGSGLNRISFFQGEWKVKSFKEHPLLSTKTLMMVAVDSKGIIWTAGNNGLIRFDPVSENLIVVPTDYGLQGQEYSASASYQDENGRLYFGGVNGLNQLNDDFLPSSESNIPILLADVKADGISVLKSTDDRYLIPAQTKFTRFYFDILDLASSAIYELRIRIPEHSEQWLPWNEQRYFDFFDLPTGDITLEIQSRSKSDSKVLDEKSFGLYVEPFYSWYDYLLWLSVFIGGTTLLFFYRRQFKIWSTEKNALLKAQLRLSDKLGFFKSELSDKSQENDQLLDELTDTLNHKQLLERQLSDLHLVDKQTGLHTKDFIRLSIENATRQLAEFYDKSFSKEESKKLPQLLFLIIKLDGFESLRLEGGQFLLNQIIIQIAAEIKKTSASTDELIRWNKDSFLLYSRSENTQIIENKCKKITQAINQGLFGPSESEKLPITCSIGVARFPFNIQHPNRFDWTLLLEIANSAACYVSQQGGDNWMIVSENDPDLDAEKIELIISDFKSALEKKSISVATSNT